MRTNLIEKLFNAFQTYASYVWQSRVATIMPTDGLFPNLCVLRWLWEANNATMILLTHF